MSGEGRRRSGNPRMHSGPSVPRDAAALIGTLAAIYLVSQFLRNSVGVIAPDLAAEIGLSAGEIGLLSSAFFFAFAAAQLPLGVAIDRYGPKRCMLVCAVIAVLGAIQFAIGTIGTLFVTAPLAWASATIGWRTTFLVVAGVMVACAVLVALVVREDASERVHPGSGETMRESLSGV